MRIQIHNVKEIETFMITLPKKLDIELTKNNTRFMERVRAGARARAPVDTGSLKESIKLEPMKKGKNVKKWKLVVGSPYGLFQEEGFTPHRFYAGGAFNSSKMAPGQSYFVSKWTPFVKPALENELRTFGKKIDKSIRRAIK